MEKPETRGRAVRDLVVQALGLRELSHATLALILLFCMLVPVAHALRLGPVLPSVFGFALVIVVARAPLAATRRAALITIGICFALYLAAQWLSIENHFVEPESDFKTQWETAIDYVNWGVQVPDRPQTQRALPFYYPLVWLFGSSSTVYLVANVVLTSLTYLMSVWIARRYFGWSSAAKTALMLLFGFEVMFAIKFPSHDVLHSFGLVLFLFLLVEFEVLVESWRWSRARTAAAIGLPILMSLTITWVDWQRGTGIFCMAAILFYGWAGFVRRLARWKLRGALAVAVCVFTMLQSKGLSSCGLIAPTNPTGLNSTEMIVLTMGTEEGDGRYGDWYRTARMATELEPDTVARLGPMLFAETLRTNAGGKYEVYLKRELNFLRTGQDAFWYLTVKDPRWLSQDEVTSLYGWLAKWTPPIWWAIALLLGIALFRRDVLFDFRIAPVILIGAFMAIMGCFAETQSRHSMFMVFVWPIYAGSPFVANPLGGVRREGPPITRDMMLRVAITLVAVIGIPLVIKQLIPRAPLANFAKARIDIGTSEWATEPVGPPPETIALRGLLHVSDFEMTGCPEAPACRPGAQSFGRTVTTTTKIYGEDEQNTLRFVLYNEIGGAFDELLPRPERFGRLPRRALRVFVDDRLAKTIDLATPFTPRVIEIPGFGKGPHFVKLALDLGEAGYVPRTAGQTCYHFWSAPMRCVGTTIAYLGFY